MRRPAIAAAGASLPRTARSLVIGSHLDTDVHANLCRLAFFGRLVEVIDDTPASIGRLRVFKTKEKRGVVDRWAPPRHEWERAGGSHVRVCSVVDSMTVIGKGMFAKDADMSRWIGLTVETETGEVCLCVHL